MDTKKEKMELTDHYYIPKIIQGQIHFLCRLLCLPITIFDAEGRSPALPSEVAVEVLTGIVLYHHLSRIEKQSIMTLIYEHFSSRSVLV